MTLLLCQTCGTHYPDAAAPPEHCPICEDERQYVGWEGQRWITHDALAATHRARIEEDDGLLGIGIAPAFAIPQRALLLPTGAGRLLWECTSLITPDAVAALHARGGVDRIIISHPHFYAGMLAWSRALGDVPILLHEADRAWVTAGSPTIQYWSGDRLALSDDVTLIRCGGHFPGSTALHWATGPRAGGALFPGDALQVAQERRHVAFMYSYPNHIPMRPSAVRGMRTRLAGLAFEDVYGFTWGRNIRGRGRAAVDASFERFFRAVEAPLSVPAGPLSDHPLPTSGARR